MEQSKPSFRERVCDIVATVPYGRVITYGDLAGLAGQANAARVVGGIAHYGDTSLPWHRVVNRFGGLARGFPGGPGVQRDMLEAEGVGCVDFTVDNFKGLRWSPYE